MKGVNHLKIFSIVVCFFTLLITIGVTMQPHRASTLPERAIRDGMTVVQSGYLGIAEGVRQMTANFRGLFHTFEENRLLREQLFNYQSLNARTIQLERENESLRELLETGDSLTGAESLNATIILRDPTTWHNFMLVNKGAQDGVVVDMAVLSRQGYLVGQIVEVYERSSRIQLLNFQDQSSNVAASIEGLPGANGLFQGHDANNGELIMNLVPRDLEVEIGSRVITNGLGGVTPAGLLIGYVERTELASDGGLTQTVYLRNEVDFNQLDFVILVRRLAVSAP